ncbi:response regulator [Aliagarivorans marinus]|uniref:response regulator n=1 Tax=Aliagarivorans marinus TaxID=561965 RepID=UPI0004214D5B|nr:response regulator [Aliagarivorans marinus]
MDPFVFAPEEDKQPDNSPKKTPWRVAIVDDEESVHQVTKFALSDMLFEDKAVEFFDAYSGKEAKQLLESNPDIAVVLLDVVMEDEHSGLEVARYIREDLHNQRIRIVLRTGQPGQAPERDVVQNYDINDYKEKTELTSRKLFTMMHGCLRAYRDIVALDDSRQGLERVIQASKNIYESRFIDEFASGVLQQLTSVLHADKDAFFGKPEALTAQDQGGNCKVVAGTGKFESLVGEDAMQHLNPQFSKLIESTITTSGQRIGDNYMAVSRGRDGQKNLLYLSGLSKTGQLEHHLLELFCDNVLVAFDNLYLKNQLIETQKELVYRLGEAVETRSRETGNHVKRVAAISRLLAKAVGLNEARAEVIYFASPLHDLGKIGIPDAILNKPGGLSDSEWEIMQGHAKIGYDLLGDSKRDILRIGALISLQHHEKWDGSGYPEGLSGEQISIEARITAVADVYDALSSDRVYKKAWPVEKVNQFMHEQAGSHFDPEVVRQLFEHIDEITAIRQKYLDKFH